MKLKEWLNIFNMATKNKLFYAEAAKGYILKVMVDTICGPLQRGYITIDKNSISLRQTDNGNAILYDIIFPRKNFRGFKCVSPMTISINLKHMQGLLRNVKKKDSIAMFIDANKPNKFFITIRPEGSRKNTRFETNSIVCQQETDYQVIDLPQGGYKYPMVIEATDFQKIKRLTTLSKIIDVSIQKDNYLSFKCDAGVVYDSELGFGELLEDPDIDDEDGEQTISADVCKKCTADLSECECVCENCNEWLVDCICVCNDCGEWMTECVCQCQDCEEWLLECKCKKDYDQLESGSVKGLFTSQYNSSILTRLVKLPGLCTQMQFYAPTLPGYPLKIEVNAGQGGFTLGTIQIFIKDVAQLAYEDTKKNGYEEPPTTLKKTKSKRPLH